MYTERKKKKKFNSLDGMHAFQVAGSVINNETILY